MPAVAKKQHARESPGFLYDTGFFIDLLHILALPPFRTFPAHDFARCFRRTSDLLIEYLLAQFGSAVHASAVIKCDFFKRIVLVSSWSHDVLQWFVGSTRVMYHKE